MERASRTSAGVSSSKQQTGRSIAALQPFAYASGPRAGRGFWRGRICRGQRGCPVRVCRPQREAFVVHLRRGQPAFLLTQLAQRVLLDVPVADALPGAAIPAAYSRVTVVLRSVWLPPWRAPRRTCHPSAWASGDTNRGAWVLLAFSTSFRPRKSFRFNTKKLLTSLLVSSHKQALWGTKKATAGGPH